MDNVYRSVDQTDGSPTENGHLVALNGRLTINEAEARRAEFIEMLPKAGRISLALGALEAVDAAGLQLLLSLKASAQGRGIGLRLLVPGNTDDDDSAIIRALIAAGICASGQANGARTFHDNCWQPEA